MGVSDISKTSFGTDPKAGMETIDAYDQQGISNFLANPLDTLANSELLSSLFPDLKADLVTKILNDKATEEFMAVSGMSFAELVNAVKRAIPPGTNLKDMIDDMDLPTILNFADRLRVALTSEQWGGIDTKFFINVYNAYMRFVKRWSKNGDWFEHLAGRAKAAINGILPTGFDVDYLLEAAYKLGVVEYIMDSGIAEDVIEWVEDSNLPDDVKRWVYSEAVSAAATTGHLGIILDLINSAGDAFEPWQRKETVRSILAGYRKPRGFKLQDAESEALSLFNLCNGIELDWHLTDRDRRTVNDAYYMQFASRDSLDVLRYYSETKYLASLYWSTNASPQSWQQHARSHFPFLSI